MLTHWNRLFTTECVVVRIKNRTVYPIFKNGFSSLMLAAEQKFINHEIRDLDNIEILLRDPEQRFFSGINEYSIQEKLDVHEVWEKVNQGVLVDRHIVPQYIWLMHLYKYYKGTILLRPWSDIDDITSVNVNYRPKTPVPVITKFVEVDLQLMSHVGQSVDLGDIIRRYRNVLS